MRTAIQNHTPMHKLCTAILFHLLLFAAAVSVRGAEISAREEAAPYAGATVYLLPIREDIMPATVRQVTRCLEEATALNASCVVIDMNTYGGVLDAADSIRTMLLDYPAPTIAFINNQAASAGALIALAADSIYMRPGASIGAATVVDGSGAVMPDKYQSFMRSMMRATAEAHGRVPSAERGDTVWRWRRDPQIAEAMVSPSTAVPDLTDGTQVVTLTADEAIAWGFCEGKASSVEELLALAGIDDYTLYEYAPSWLDRFIGFLTNPTLQALFIILIIGGIYFELQTPGVGFPLVVAILGAVLYFAPLYAEGLAAHWELLLFLTGIVLIILEIFVTPGFGVLGILGIVAMITGLAFALIDTALLRYVPTGELPVSVVLGPFLIVIISAGVGLLLSIWFGNRFLRGKSGLRRRVVLVSDMKPADGYVSVAADRPGRHHLHAAPPGREGGHRRPTLRSGGRRRRIHRKRHRCHRHARRKRHPLLPEKRGVSPPPTHRTERKKTNGYHADKRDIGTGPQTAPEQHRKEKRAGSRGRLSARSLRTARRNGRNR